MKKRFLYGTAVFSLAVLVALVVWQGSFDFGAYGPSTSGQTYLLWSVSTLIFILMVTLGFMLVRTGVKLYVERRAGREGSRIRTKLVVGALALSIMPVFFLVVFSIYVLNRNLDKWFSRPATTILSNLVEVSNSFDSETRRRSESQARWLAGMPEMREYQRSGHKPALFTEAFCRANGIEEAFLRVDGSARLAVCAATAARRQGERLHTAAAGLSGGGGDVVVRARTPVDLAFTQSIIERENREFDKLLTARKEIRWSYILLLVLISLFILFVATWIALFLSKQISGPIQALLTAAGELRKGNLGYRISAQGQDELGTLIRGFNDMARELETNKAEIERRRQFIEAILESIPTGVISLSAERRIRRVNSALGAILGAERVTGAATLEDLFPAQEAGEILYLTNRAWRTGQAAAQMDLERPGAATLHLGITVAVIDSRQQPGFVIVVEDTSELLRAQKAAAWHEVARRIAHEMKNPLTPIALCAERIGRQLDRVGKDPERLTPEVVRVLHECSLTISGEVQSVKTLVDEFSQFARFPAAQLAPSDLNEVVEGALQVFSGQLAGVEVTKELADGLPRLMLDREQFKRVVVNLIDNAAEAMRDAEVRRLTVMTHLAGQDTVELVVSDTGHGISARDRERLFLPYFSTKNRGTGLGLAIVHHILDDHGAQIRVLDNVPAGARFVVEIPAAPPEGDATEARMTPSNARVGNGSESGAKS
ncbi:MAG: HAMP domain-containing protein [Bryobacterales bacterium]|nr:HAMP domain-containing protein [Bryobacterales bacterium]